MIFGKTKLELKVGIFVFLALLILTVFILSIGGIKTWASGYKVNFTFKFVNGVKIGAPVRFAGVDVGQIKRIDFINSTSEETKILLACWVKSGIRIPIDSTIWVNTLGLLGEKYVEIMPGSDYSHFLAANQSLAGVDPIPMHEIFRMTNGIVENLGETLTRIKNKEGTLGKLIYEDSIYKNLDALILDIKNNPWKLFIKQKEKK
jgi:phospholipid/cholesterol/gamma-HCH transport system substrate-binding protein